MILRQVGDMALLVDEVAPDVADRLRRLDWPSEVLDVVPGAATVLVRARPGSDLAPLARLVRESAGTAAALGGDPGGAGGRTTDDPRARPEVDPDGPEVVLAVRYDGADLTEVARLTGLSEREVVVAHTGTPWRVAFMGFAPGFGYLTGGDPRLAVPRRDHPRPSVPPGSVGLAGPYSGVYPRASPGGWQLLGTTTEPLWDLALDPPAVLRPGVRVRFVERP